MNYRYGDNVLHLNIFEDSQGKFSLREVKFNSLVELIDYYRESNVSNLYDVRLMDMPEVKNV